MDQNDLINGGFELIGALLLSLNIIRLWKQKTLQGVHWLPTAFFALWGCWNLFYYPSLHQWFSFFGGVSVVVVNGLWLFLVYYYRQQR